MARNQAEDAQKLYDHRASKYDDSWHPRFTRHIIELVQPQAGEHVLDLACGTGLASFAASKAVGPSGKVVGVDITPEMLQEATAKLEAHEPKNVTFYRHSVTDLESLDAIRDSKFDLITCCSALVLFERPQDALKDWVKFLKPGGRLVVDVTHPRSLRPYILMEKVGNATGRPVPWYRLNFITPEDLGSMMSAAGLVDLEVTLMAQRDISGSDDLRDYIGSFDKPRVFQEYEVTDVDEVFEKQMGGKAQTACFGSSPEIRAKAKEIFKSEWQQAADEHGKVQEVDGVFVGLGWKTM